MSFSGTTVDQRSKEVEALKSFLTYSLIGSLALHIGVLSSGIGNYLIRVPTGEEEPIEVAIIDAPTPEPEKPIEKIPEEPKIVEKQSIETPIVQKPVQELLERPKIQPVQEPKQTTPIQPVQEPKQTTQNPQPTNREIAPKPEVPVKTVAPQSGGGGGGGGGSSVLTDNSGSSGSGVALSTGSGTGTGTGTGTGSGIGSGRGSGIGSGSGSGIGSGIGSGRGSGIGSGSGSGIGNGVGNRPTVATAPIPPTPPKVNSSDNGNGSPACRKCGFKYPESFKRRGIEGRTGLAFDTDNQGNVTNVRVTSSSGNRELDEEQVRQAREWKFNSAQGGRQGVRVNSSAYKEGSQQYRQYQQQRKREVEERTQQVAAAANSVQENPRRRRRELTPPSNQATATRPAISGLSRRLEPQRREIITSGSSSEARINRTQGSARESLRRIRRERADTNSSQQPQATTNRRPRENTSQSKLRDSLRGLRQQRQSQPAAPPAAPSQQ
ncbi:energy transducer TonB [Nostoc sp.]|uniref:energy transducer TonB n=1 Tax=Nostoc sp. TaxID=1180 RepID=UPI002FF538CF